MAQGWRMACDGLQVAASERLVADLSASEFSRSEPLRRASMKCLTQPFVLQIADMRVVTKDLSSVVFGNACGGFSVSAEE